MSKSEKYFFDNEAIKESCINTPEQQIAKRNKEPHKGQIDPGGKRETTGGFDKITKVYEGRNKRSVWTVSTRPFKEAHFATFPPQLIEPCVKAGSKAGDTILDPFSGAGTTGLVAFQHEREFIGIELNPEYAEIATRRIEHERNQMPLLEAMR
jgi:DNA modification methylase